MDVSPKQLVSVAAGLIPFLEHDDANRALMGSNMQRQGVPLLVTEVAARRHRSGRQASLAIRAPSSSPKKPAKSLPSPADQIIITKDGETAGSARRRSSTIPTKGIYVYELRKFMRSNAGTCINQKPIVKKGQHVKKGQVIADGPYTRRRRTRARPQRARRVHAWNGYNFEDAILISREGREGRHLHLDSHR